jgi:uncharacterized membrane protein YkoI
MIRVPFLALVLLASAAAADDHDRARRAVERGEVLPLATILPQVEAALDARVIEVDLERDDGRFIYEFELIDPRGRIIEAEVDAATGRLLEVEREDD